MKLIQAVIRPFKLDDVHGSAGEGALLHLQGLGPLPPGLEKQIEFVPILEIEIVAPDGEVAGTFERETVADAVTLDLTTGDDVSSDGTTTLFEGNSIVARVPVMQNGRAAFGIRVNILARIPDPADPDSPLVADRLKGGCGLIAGVDYYATITIWDRTSGRTNAAGSARMPVSCEVLDQLPSR
jgi:nitrogen regulatory protein PII